MQKLDHNSDFKVEICRKGDVFRLIALLVAVIVSIGSLIYLISNFSSVFNSDNDNAYAEVGFDKQRYYVTALFSGGFNDYLLMVSFYTSTVADGAFGWSDIFHNGYEYIYGWEVGESYGRYYNCSYFINGFEGSAYVDAESVYIGYNDLYSAWLIEFMYVSGGNSVSYEMIVYSSDIAWSYVDLFAVADSAADTAYTRGYRAGALANNAEIYDFAYEQGIKQGQQDGYNDGFDDGYTDGYSNGYADGDLNGYNVASNTILPNSLNYISGYNAGLQQGYTMTEQDYTFNGLISSVVDVPIHAFTSMFNFEVLGVNLADVFLALLSVSIVITIIRLFLR